MEDTLGYNLNGAGRGIERGDNQWGFAVVGRYFRLLKNRPDAVIKGLLGGEIGDVDTDSARTEELVERLISGQDLRPDGTIRTFSSNAPRRLANVHSAVETQPRL